MTKSISIKELEVLGKKSLSKAGEPNGEFNLAVAPDAPNDTLGRPALRNCLISQSGISMVRFVTLSDRVFSPEERKAAGLVIEPAADAESQLGVQSVILALEHLEAAVKFAKAAGAENVSLNVRNDFPFKLSFVPNTLQSTDEPNHIKKVHYWIAPSVEAD